MLLRTRYFDDYGKIIPFSKTIEISGANENDIQSYVDEMNSSILYIRGISDYAEITIENNRVKSDNIMIDLVSSPIHIMRPAEPTFGRIDDGILRNISLIFQVNKGLNPTINLLSVKNDTNHLNLILNEITPTGIYAHHFVVKLTFVDDWRETCGECQTALYALNQLFDKLNQQLYINTTVNKHIKISGNIVDDFRVDSVDNLTESLNKFINFEQYKVKEIEVQKLL